MRDLQVLLAVFGSFGDAYGSGFGNSILNEAGINSYQVGVWSYLEASNSSNRREFTNVVDAIEEEASNGNLDNSELFSSVTTLVLRYITEPQATKFF